ncbi:hypothetical protein [Nitrospina gracilis]|uniref:hypothetical protein n=1 Tax=Nitrospina gracilis TaxID=35801 RepID=UPI001F2B00BE|nr:hypothetical protein [Nitrospina gracilis]MCF8719206.1 hypothetical protein [Nitrospina gracilis Nb-211]
METFPAGFETERNKTTNAPVHVLKMEWPQVGVNPAATLYLADQALTIGAQSYLAVVSDWGSLDGLYDPDALVGTSFSDMHIQLINAPVDYGSGAERFSDFVRRYPLAAAKATLFMWFQDAGLGEPELAERFTARPEGNIEWDDELIEFDLVIISKSYGERVIGGVIGKNQYPKAPTSSFGTAKPIVVGTVERVPGVPVRGAAKTKITSVVLASDSVVNVADTTKFPASGALLINDDEVTYSGKTATQFIGVAGINQIHYDGDEVIEKISDYRFLFSDPGFPIKDLRNIQVGDALADISINPYTPNVAAGEVSFQRPPRRVESYDTRFWPVEFDAVDGQNTALNPLNAVSRNDFENVASINQANPKLSLVQNDSLNNLGPINRVLLRVSHNADEKLVNDNVTAQIRGLGAPFTLSKPAPVDEVNYSGDVDISHETLENLSWDLSEELHQHTATSQADHVTVQRASSPYGGKTELSAGQQTLVVQFPLEPEGVPIKTEYRIVIDPTPEVLNFSIGGNPQIKFGTNVIATWDAQRGAFTVSESFQVGGSGGNLWSMSITNGFVRFSIHSIERLLFYPPQPATQDKNLQNQKSGAIQPTTGTRSVSGTPTKTTQIHTQFFDITSLVAGDWNWFQGKVLDITYNGTSDGRTVYIAMAFIEIEYTRRRLVQTDEVFADVDGVKDGDGSITGVADTLIERPDHAFAWLLLKGAGLTSNEIDSASFMAAGTSYATAIAGGYKFGGVIEGRSRLRDIWDRWRKECRSDFWWDEQGRAVLRYRPLNKGGSLPAPVKTIPQSMIRRTQSGKEMIRFKETETTNIVTSLDVKYRYSLEAGDFQGTITREDSASIGLFGRKDAPRLEDFRFVRSDEMAEHLAEFYITQHATPSVVVEAELFLDAAELEKGDIIAFTHPNGNYNEILAEILSVSRRHGSGRDGVMNSIILVFRIFPAAILEDTFAESISISEAITLLATYVVAQSETVNVSEASAMAETMLLLDGSITDVAGGYGQQGYGNTGYGGKDFDAITVSEAISSLLTSVLSEGVNVTEAVLQAITQVNAETVNVTESAAQAETSVQPEIIQISEVLAGLVGLRLSEVIEITESQAQTAVQRHTESLEVDEAAFAALGEFIGYGQQGYGNSEYGGRAPL